MSEELNRDPLLQTLVRLTPSSRTIDRDAMLFAAGQAAGSSSRGWKLLASSLALSQAAMLAIWIMGPSLVKPQLQSGSVIASDPLQRPIIEPGAGAQAESPGSYGSLMRHLEHDGLPTMELDGDPMPAGPALSADLRTQLTSFK